MEHKTIKKYLSQEVTGYNSDFSKLFLLCKILYVDGSIDWVTEIRPTLGNKMSIDDSKSLILF